ncbi:hypothetical protein KKB84_01110 [bacterium]|nr:hypothetical protein [bacterium]
MTALDNKSELVKNMNVIIAAILAIAGVILTISLLNNFSKGGMFSSAKLEPSEIAISLLVGFYHLLFAGLCYATSTALSSTEKNSSWLENVLDVFGWSSIIIGCIGFLAITSMNAGSMASMSTIISPILTVFYSLTLGLICFGTSKTLKGEPNPSLENTLPAFAVILIIVGLISSVVLLNGFAKGGAFSSARLELSEIIVALLVGFYHFILAGLCYGVYCILKRIKPKSSQFDNILKNVGWLAVFIGVVGAIIGIVKGSDIGFLSQYAILIAVAFGLYSSTLGILSLGVYEHLKIQAGESQAGESGSDLESRIN